MNTSSLNTLVSLGASYAQISGLGASPDDYARKAAHLLTRTATADLGAESPDSIAFIESISALSALLAATQLSARLADKGAGMRTASIQYDTTLSLTPAIQQTSTEHSPTDTPISHETSLNASQFQTLIEQVHAAYDTIRKQKLSAGELAWNEQSCMRYLHAYTCARAAYLHAMAVSARYTAPQTKQHAFESTLRTRLREDLFGEPLSPCFFMQVMCHDTMKIAGALLLLLGLLALSLLTACLINPAAGIALTEIGLSSPVLAPIAINGCVLGTGIFTSRFFLEKNEREKNKQSQEAIEQLNNLAPQAA